MNARVPTAASGEKSNHLFLITHPVLECLPNMKVAYLLSIRVNALVHIAASGEKSDHS